MKDFLYLVPIAIGLGVMGLFAFMWSLRNGQYEDMEGAAERILFEEADKPIISNGRRTGQDLGRNK